MLAHRTLLMLLLLWICTVQSVFCVRACVFNQQKEQDWDSNQETVPKLFTVIGYDC